MMAYKNELLEDSPPPYNNINNHYQILSGNINLNDLSYPHDQESASLSDIPAHFTEIMSSPPQDRPQDRPQGAQPPKSTTHEQDPLLRMQHATAIANDQDSIWQMSFGRCSVLLLWLLMIVAFCAVAGLIIVLVISGMKKWLE